MSNIISSYTSETVHGRKLEGLRWQGGKLQALYSEKYEQTENGRYLGGGSRERWEDVPGDPPAPASVQSHESTSENG
jgi:hypothetical protein